MAALQFNLLPDVKLEYIKVQRSRKVATSVAILVSSVAIAILLIMLFTVEVVQKKQINDAQKAVTTASQQISSIPGISKVLTVQNQLTTLTGLHQNKHITSRVFDYLQAITPSNVQITSVSLDTTQNSMTISGIASSQLAVNTFIDTLKFAQYKVNASDSAQSAFSSVVESSFALTSNGASYTISATFAPALFTNSTQTPQIILQNKVTTRSVLEDPSDTLFSAQPNKTGSQ